MLYALICTDKENSEELRKTIRPDHLDYLKNFNVKMAGPMLADDNSTMIGSIILIECNSKMEAEDFASGDPYKQAELFTKVSISGFRQSIPPS